MTDSIDINQVAAILSVTAATVRNWVKADKIVPISKKGRNMLFCRESIEKIKIKIATGESNKLQNRRNKKAVKGNFVPTSYVESSQYQSLAEKIYLLSKEIYHPCKIRLILFEICLNLLKNRGHLTVETNEGKNCLTILVLKEKLYLGAYKEILEDLMSQKELMDISDKDLNILARISQLNIPFIEGQDFLGLVYLSLNSLSHRKVKGSYYTPTSVVKDLVTETFKHINAKSPSIIDPCCGSGNFLMEAFIKLKAKLMEENYPTNIEREILRNLRGIDIDKIAVTLAKINIALHLENKLPKAAEIQIDNCNALKDLNHLHKFDVVIGNPPWGFDFSKEEALFIKDKYITAKKHIESFSLFIESSLKLLKDKGIISFVLPESILNVSIHSSIRKLLLDQTDLMEINTLGEKFSNVYTSSVTLTAIKGKTLTENEHKIVIKENGAILHKINQGKWLANCQYIFNIKASDEEFAILDKMTSLPKVAFLKNNADFALGIVTGDNKEFVKSQKFIQGENILKGKNIFKYNYYTEESYIKFEPEKFQQVAPEEYYRSNEKILYRFINTNLVFAYDDKKTLSLNSANIIIPRFKDLNVKYVLAILNSRSAQFFHELSYNSIKVLRKHIESIPIPFCPLEEQRKIVGLVNKILKSRNPDERKKIYNLIDEHVMDLFGFSQGEILIINKRVNNIKYLFRP